MKKRDYTRVVIPMVVTGLLGVLLIGGCWSGHRTARLPDTPRLVGGGMMIEWRAPERGTVYLVEKCTRKVVETRSLEEGGIYKFAATSVVQADEFEQMLGIRFSKAQFQLYFEPAGAAGTDIDAWQPPGQTWGRF
jgi:hypothetical protein